MDKVIIGCEKCGHRALELVKYDGLFMCSECLNELVEFQLEEMEECCE